MPLCKEKVLPNFNNVITSSSLLLSLRNETNSTLVPRSREENDRLFAKLQFIKAIVLIVVVAALLLSSCRLIFKTFSKYAASATKRNEV